MNFIIEKLDEFEKEFSSFKKKFKTLDNDFESFLNYSLFIFHKDNIDNNCFFSIEWIKVDWISIQSNENFKFYVAKKFSCASLKWKWVKSGFRLVHCYDKINNKIIFIEIYHKNDKIIENFDRIKKFYKNLIKN